LNITYHVPELRHFVFENGLNPKSHELPVQKNRIFGNPGYYYCTTDIGLGTGTCPKDRTTLPDSLYPFAVVDVDVLVNAAPN
jgi:hypothetical protein